MGICSGIVIILEIIFKIKGKVLSKLIIAYFICHLVFDTFTDVIEKYLIEYDFIDAFILLASEGAFEIVLCSIYSCVENPFNDTKNYHNNEKK